MASFRGFSPDLFAFLKGLKTNNSKAWFDKHRTDYEEHVREPIGEFVDTLASLFANAKLPLTGSRKSLFRLNRDIRFSKDKSPYKTNAGAVMTKSGDKKEPGMLYIHFQPGESFVAAGYYMCEPPVLTSLRTAIASEPKTFLKVIAKLKAKSLELSDQYTLKRLPKGFEETDASVSDYVKYTSFVVSCKFDDTAVLAADYPKQVVTFAKAAMPLLEFGNRALN